MSTRRTLNSGPTNYTPYYKLYNKHAEVRWMGKKETWGRWRGWVWDGGREGRGEVR